MKTAYVTLLAATALLGLAAGGRPARELLAYATQWQALPSFASLVSANTQALSESGAPNLAIIPSNPVWDALFKINTDEDYAISYSSEDDAPVMQLGYTHDTTTEVYMPQSLPLKQLDLMGNNRVSIGHAGNKNDNGTCVRYFNIADKLALNSQGATDITVDCVTAPLGTLEFVTQGSSIYLQHTSVTVDKLAISTVQGSNRMTISNGDAVDVNKLVIGDVQGELLIDIETASTQIKWSNSIGGELYIKTTGSAAQCPFFDATAARNYGGEPIGCSIYCCGPSVDIEAKTCGGGANVMAGNVNGAAAQCLGR